MQHWKLEGHEVVEVSDLLPWARWFETADRKVAHTTVGAARISTVFLGIDHNFSGKGPPLLFETMVFDESADDDDEELTRRYATWDEAQAGHDEIVKAVTGAQA